MCTQRSEQTPGEKEEKKERKKEERRKKKREKKGGGAGRRERRKKEKKRERQKQTNKNLCCYDNSKRRSIQRPVFHINWEHISLSSIWGKTTAVIEAVSCTARKGRIYTGCAASKSRSFLPLSLSLSPFFHFDYCCCFYVFCFFSLGSVLQHEDQPQRLSRKLERIL